MWEKIFQIIDVTRGNKQTKKKTENETYTGEIRRNKAFKPKGNGPQMDLNSQLQWQYKGIFIPFAFLKSH